MMINQPALPAGVDLEVLLEKLRTLSWGAAEILRAYARREQPPFGFSKVLEVQEKKEGPVSAADFAVNTWLLDGFKSYFPNVPWTLLSEETARSELNQGKVLANDWIWILDPLDGTKDFLQGSSDYAVHLALLYQKCPVLGLVLLPELEQLWFGVCGLGAWCENSSRDKSPVCLSHRELPDDLLVISSRNHRNETLESLLEKLPYKTGKKVGSVGCKVAAILRGEADIYISLSGKSAPKDWDMAAPEAVLASAGGQFTHADGRALVYNKGDFLQEGCLIASHGRLHEVICSQIRSALLDINPFYQI